METKIFEKTYKIGNIGKQTVYVTIEINKVNRNTRDWNLNKINEYYTLSLTGEVKRGRRWEEGGQIDSTIREALERAEFVPSEDLLYSDIVDLLDIWEQWHLNDLTPGTQRQMLALRQAGIKGDYEKELEYLRSVGLEYDRGYHFGYSWLVRPIPEALIKRLQKNIWAFPKELRWY